MDIAFERKLTTYYITAIFGVIFAIIGFSYNAWRMEISEDNNNIRTASFEILKELASLEQLIYSAHYDNNPEEGNPRKGWVKVGLIVDLSGLVSDSVYRQAMNLEASWTKNWAQYSQSRDATDTLVELIDRVRSEIKLTLASLK